MCGWVRRLEACPGPAASHGRRSQALRTLRRPPHRRRLVADVWLGASARCPVRPRRRPSSFARNSLATISNIEFRSLQLQRFQTLLKLLPIELCARFLWSCPCRPSNVACNSLTALSNYEFRLLELQCFQTLLKLLPIELHATFLRPGSAVTFRLRGQALRLEVCSVPSVSATLGVLPGVA